MGCRRIKNELAKQGIFTDRKRVNRLMRCMGIYAIYPKPKLSKRNESHKIYPYLLRNQEVTRSNQVWCTDITYIPMSKGFLYLIAVMDWHSRKVLSWQLSNTMDTDFCVDALQEAIAKYGKPDIFNTDQGSQFTSKAFTDVLKKHSVQISMDGKGRWVDNVFIERLWRSVKYEEVYLKAYESPREAEQELERYFKFYNEERCHQGLDEQTPNQVYLANLKSVA